MQKTVYSTESVHDPGTLIQRLPLRSQVRAVIRTWIVDGILRSGARIQEPGLAARLGVSRTPIREALLSLERDGFVRSEQGRGFTVVPLSVELIQHIYPLLGSLERLALRLIGPDAADACPQLRRINDQIGSSGKDTMRQFTLDRQWHELLLERCPDRRLLEMIKDHTALIRRFDGAVTRGVADLSMSCRQHADVLGAIEAGDIHAASDFLEEHWNACIEPVAKWLGDHAHGGG